MADLQPVRGTHDILADDFRLHRHICDRAAALAARHGFQEMTPPIFEFTEVFSRTLGETSDVVTKEMYTFDDRGGDSITLRPEFTAGIARAFMSNGLAQEAPLKFFARGPVFRHERPQKGRLRQFHQIDVEILGVPGAQADIEVIALAAHILDDLGVAKDVRLELNTLGDPESRQAYRGVLLDYLAKYRNDLSEDSRTRMDKNPLRIFDSKDKGDQDIMSSAPLLQDHLNDTSRVFFDEVLAGLDALGIAYEVQPRLVRGLDYYSHTAFEFVTGTLGAQGTVLAGGRYDGLMEQMGGRATPGIGWAAGVERLSMMLGTAPAGERPIVVIPMGDEAMAPAMKAAHDLRRAGHTIDMGYSGNLKKRLARANKANAKAVLILGSDELARGVATLRNMESGTQAEVKLSDIVETLKLHF
ncbi:MAG TPA: histidine--tRNA ligase [Rhodospirillaceae bacterium]|nr:histidine--tRNA ligase [Magnetovibrio sp.]HCS70244.1 histidine--tRNA ligase [Rhodospirillaceae bacterium]|tara:strand:- start:7971 stop:9215 length:1245 start_codon:yes stop_codon:yes gene_type:complete